MAEESGGGSWWSSWDKVLDTVKESSNNVYQLVAKDLQEFVTTIQTDTTEVIAETAHAVKEKLEVEEGSDQEGGTASFVKQGVSSWLGNVSSSLKEGINKVSTASLPGPSQPHSSAALTIDRAKARVEQMQTDPGTYCNEPDGPIDLYMNWCEGFNLEDHKGEISELLVNNTKVRALYTNLVPGAVTHSLFWHRYFYKLHQFDEEDRRKAVLMARASQIEHEDLGWGDDDDLWGGEEMKVVDIEQVLVTSAHEQSMTRDAITDKQPTAIDHPDNTQHTLEEQSNLRTAEIQETPTLDTRTEDELSAKHSTSVNLENKTVGTSEEHETELNEKLENLKLDSPASTTTSAIMDDEHSQESEGKMPDRNELKDTVEDVEVKVESTTKEPEKCKGTSTPSEETSNSDDSGSFVKVPLDTLQQQHSKSDVSDDGSWAKLSDEDLVKDEVMLKEARGIGMVLSPGSSSMSSPVHVLSVDGKEEEEDVKEEGDDIWDEDFDLDEDIPDDEVQRIVEAMKNKDPSQVAEDDDDDWEDWE